MNGRMQLVLDVAGVLAANLSSGYWHAIADEAGVPSDAVKTEFQSIRRALWTGKLREADFWPWLGERYASLDLRTARERLIRSLEPLPAARRLAAWSEAADLHLLSNHCCEWLEPLLREWEPWLQSATISNRVGLCKPDAAIYEAVAERLVRGAPVLYVDDQQKNLPPASQLGWSCLLADERGEWTAEVDRRLLPTLR